MSQSPKRDLHATVDLPGSDAELVLLRLEGEEALSELFRFELLLACRGSKLDLDETVGSPLRVHLQGPGGERWIHGMVSRIEQHQSGRAYTVYRAVVVPRAFRLGLGQDFRIFQRENAASIVTAVLDASGIPHSFQHKGNQQPEEREYCVQYRESDWAFVSRLLEDEGYTSFFEHQKDAHTLRFCNTPEAHPTLPVLAVRYHAPDGLEPAADEVTRLSLSRSVCVGSVTLDDYRYLRPDLELKAERLAPEHWEIEEYDVPGGHVTSKEGERRAQVRLEAHQSGRLVVSGESTCATFVAGSCVTVLGHGSDALVRPLLITRVRHRLEGAKLDLDTGTPDPRCRYENSFRCIQKAVPFRPSRRTPRPVVQGVQTAVVTGPKQEELHTDEHGRVKLRFHWDRAEIDDHKRTCWVRVSQLWAGQGYGAYFLPRVGHEVIVEFEDGDPDRPLVTGRVYNGLNVPPEALPAKASRSTILGHSTPGGHGGNELAFEDHKGAEELYLHAQRNLREVVRNDRIQTVGADRTATVKGNDVLTVQEGHRIIGVDNGHLDVTVAWESREMVRGGKRLTVVEGGNQVTVEKGHMLVDVNQDDHRLCVHQGNSRVNVVNGCHTLTVKSGLHETVEAGDRTLLVPAGKNAEKVQGPYSISVEKDYFQVSCGQSTLMMTAGGRIVLSSGYGEIEICGAGIKITSATGHPVEINT